MIQSGIDIQQRYFDKRHNQYDPRLLLQPQKHVKIETDIILNQLRTIKTGIVDFGAGTGRLTIPLIQSHRHVVAVDTSKKSLLVLQRLATKMHKARYLKTAHNIREITSLNAIVGCDILHHIDLNKYMTVWYSCLKPGGKIIFSEPNPWNLSWLIYISLYSNWVIEKGIFHCNAPTLISILRKAGYNSISIRGLGLLPLPLFNSFPFFQRLNLFLGDLPFIRYFAYRLIIEAVK